MEKQQNLQLHVLLYRQQYVKQLKREVLHAIVYFCFQNWNTCTIQYILGIEKVFHGEEKVIYAPAGSMYGQIILLKLVYKVEESRRGPHAGSKAEEGK